MFKKGLKPQTHLIIDLLQFILLAWLVFTAILMVHYEFQGKAREEFMFEVSHVITGICLCLMVAFHILFHLPWIRAQLPRLFKRRDRTFLEEKRIENDEASEVPNPRA